MLCSLLGCESATEQTNIVTSTYQRIEADWLTHQESMIRKESISNIRYILQVDITKADRYSGNVEIRFDYNPSEFPLTIDFVGGEAERILVNNTPIAIEYGGYYINIPNRHLDEGANIIKIQYSHPYSDNGSGLYRYRDPTDNRTYLYTHFEPYDANKLFPSFDQPNLRATYKLKVVAPKNWTVVSAVREDEVINDGPYNRWSFPESAEFSTYIFPLHAGPWHIWEAKADKIPLRLLTRQSLASDVNVREWFRITIQGFKFYEDYFNIPYPYEKYDQLIVPDFNIGGMENVAAVTFTERYVPRGKITISQKRNIADTILHELSHMWFGDLVTIDWWSSLWLKESFASYMAPLALSKATDYKDAWRAFYSNTKQQAYLADQRVTTHPIDMEVLDTKSGDASFDSITYNKGASALQQLAHYLGEDTFRHGIRLYLKEHQNKAAKLDDFFNALNRASGINLETWKSNWINQAGVNTLKTEYQCLNGKISEFTIQQSALDEYPFLRNHKVKIALYQQDEGGRISSSQQLAINIRGKNTKIEEFIGLPCPLLVYPNQDDWGYVKVQLDTKSQLLLPNNINGIDDPLSRAMFWQGMWDLVLEIKAPITQYMAMVLKNGATEIDPEILNQILSNMITAKNWLMAAGHLNNESIQLLADLEQLFLNQSLASSEGSDLQSIWYHYFTEIAHTPKALDHLSNWLQSKAEPSALVDNQDKRWQVLIKLSLHAHPAIDALTELELRRDKSDNASMMVLAVKAVSPNIETKQYWMDEFVRNEERQSAARLKQAMTYLFPAEQKQYQNTFADRILEDLHYLDSHRGQVLVEHLINKILPSMCHPESVARLRSAQNNMHTLGLIARKGIMIAHQEDQRCVDINALLKKN